MSSWRRLKEHEKYRIICRRVRWKVVHQSGWTVQQFFWTTLFHVVIIKLYRGFFTSRKRMITVSAKNKTISAANSLLNNNFFSISATAFITNIHSSYDRRQISRHSWNCSPTKQRREFQNKLHLETSFLTNISNLVAVYFCFLPSRFKSFETLQPNSIFFVM